MKYDVTMAGETRSIDVRRHPEGGWWVSVDGGERRHVTGESVGAAEFLLRDGESVHTFGLARTDRGVHLQLDGHALLAEVVDPRKAALSLAGGKDAGAVSTAMPGAIVRVLVDEGQAVTEGDPVIVVEAMKMENELRSPKTGVIEAIHVEPGQAVEAGALLITVGDA